MMGDGNREIARTKSGKPTILVVDDDRAVCDLTGTMLELKGYRVLRAGGGEEALAVLERHGHAIDLLLADIVMPVMSGPRLAQEVRRRRPSVPVVFISGLVSYGNFQGVLGGRFLAKPYTPQILAAKVEEALEATA